MIEKDLGVPANLPCFGHPGIYFSSDFVSAQSPNSLVPLVASSLLPTETSPNLLVIGGASAAPAYSCSKLLEFTYNDVQSYNVKTVWYINLTMLHWCMASSSRANTGLKEPSQSAGGWLTQTRLTLDMAYGELRSQHFYEEKQLLIRSLFLKYLLF